MSQGTGAAWRRLRTCLCGVMVLAAQAGLMTVRGLAAPLDIPEGLPVPSALVATRSIKTNPDAATKIHISEAYGKLPLNFEANHGQTDERVRFLARGPGYTLFLTATEAVLALRTEGSGLRTDPSELRTEQRVIRDETTATKKEEHRADNVRRAVVRMKVVGANAQPKLEGLDELPGNSNYFIGNDPKKWRRNIPHYSKVRYREAYPGIDLVFYGSPRQLEYDFVISPGADPEMITLAFEGVDRLEIDNEGNLILHIAGGHLIQRAPNIYQEIDGARQAITSHYVLRDKNRIGVHVAAYDLSKPLVVDPVLVYSTYLGGGNADDGNAIAVDGAGNAYVTGSTASANFPVFPIPGAFQITLANAAGQLDAFVSKLNATGTALVYSTYLGGGNSDIGRGIAVDGAGNAYVTGETPSTDFPTTAGAFDTTFGGGGVSDAFVTMLNPAGGGTADLVYSTFLGGSSRDVGSGIAVDAAPNTYVTGFTESGDFPTTGGAFDTTFGGGAGITDAFVTKLNPALVYSTYLGGSAADIGNGIALDDVGNAYVTGKTSSANFPTGGTPIQAALSVAPDAFVTKLMESPAPPPPPPPTPGGGGGDDGGSCFIAVAAFGSPLAPQVQLLREFRDRYLLTHGAGRLFVAAYYRVSPPLAKRVAQSEILRSLVRAGLLPILAWTKLALWSPGLGLAMTLVCPGLGSWLILKVSRRREGRT